MPALLLTCALVVETGIQATPHQYPQVFRSGVDIVRLDVAVLDGNRRPMLGLTARDFTILVDGIPQPIVAFEPVAATPRLEPTVPWMRDVAPDVRTNALAEPRLVVIVMDDVATLRDPFELHTGREIGRAIVDQLGPGDLAAVLFTDPLGRRNSQPLTDDRAKLLKAVNSFTIGMGGPLMGISARRTITDALTYLRDRPQNRGMLIVIGPGLNSLFRSGPRSREVELTQLLDGQAAPTTSEIGQMSALAQTARIPVYWFNTRGLSGNLFGDALHPLVSSAGGRAINNTNTPAAEVPNVFEENRAWYVIGYRATHPVGDGRYRRMQIRVNQPGVQVFPGDRVFRSPKPASRRPTAPGYPLQRAMSDILPEPGLPLHVNVVPFAIPRTRNGSTATLAVTVGVRHPPSVTPYSATPYMETVELLGRVFTVQGKAVADAEHTATLRLEAGAEGSQYEMFSRLDVKPGRYVVRYSIRSAALNRVGSVYTDITVPDFRREPLSLSGIILSATPSLPAALQSTVSSLTPVMPTTQRKFAESHTVRAFARVYQGGSGSLQPVECEAVLTDRQGVESTVHKIRLTAEHFREGRAADCLVDLSMSSLEPGPYLLTLRVTAVDASADDRVRFLRR